MPKLSARLLWSIIIVALLAAIAGVLVLLLRPSLTPTAEVAELLTQGGQTPPSPSVGLKVTPMGTPFGRSTTPPSEQVAAEMRSRANASDLC